MLNNEDSPFSGVVETIICEAVVHEGDDVSSQSSKLMNNNNCISSGTVVLPSDLSVADNTETVVSQTIIEESRSTDGSLVC